MRLVKFWNFWAALIGLAAILAPPAAAEEPVETAIKAWVATIDASPDWRASYGGLAVNPQSGRAALVELSVTSEVPGFSLSFRTVTVNGFQPTTDGTFTAQSIDLLGGEVRAGIFSVLTAKATLTAPALPTTGGFTWDDARPFAAMVKALAPLARVKMESARAASIVVTETLQGVATRTTYDQVKVDGWSGGKIGAISAGPLRTDSPAVDPLVTLAARSAETRDIDLDAFLAVYDLDRYAGGVGNRVWRTAVGRAVYRDVAITVPGVTLKIGGTSIEDFRLRQPTTPPPFDAPATEAPAAGPAALLHQLDVLSAYGVGRFAVRDVDVEAAGLEKLHFGGLSFADLSMDAIGSFAIDDMAAAIVGQGSVKIGRLGFGGLALPSVGTLKAALAAREAGGDVDYSSLIPPLSYVEMAGVDVAIAALPPVQLGRFRVDLGKYVGKVPTTIAADLAGADFPARMIPNDRARTMLQTFGYDRVRLDGGAKVDWSFSGDVAVKDFRLAMKDVGGVSGNADLSGLTPMEAEHMADPTAALDKLALKRAAITFTDDSVVGRVIGAQAERLKVDPVKFREQFANGLPFMLTFLGDRALQAQLAPVLQTFVKNGGSITATVAPTAPLALSALTLAVQTSPFSLFGLLSATITGTAGTPQPPTNEIRKSIEPGN